jgi:hypothetical protein
VGNDQQKTQRKWKKDYGNLMEKIRTDFFDAYRLLPH